MNLINGNDCNANKLSNTGLSTCGQTLSQLRGMIYVPADYSFAPTGATIEAQKAAFLADLKTKVLVSPIGARALPLFAFAELSEVKTEAKAVTKKGAQTIVSGKESADHFVYELEDVGHRVWKKLRSMGSDRPGIRCFPVDINGYLVHDLNAAGDIIPFELQYSWFQKIEPMTGTDTSTAYKYEFMISKIGALNDDINIVDFGAGFLEDEISGLYDVDLAATGGTGAITASGSVFQSGENLYDKFADALAKPTAWVLVNESTNAVVAASAVAKVVGSKSWSITAVAGTYTLTLAAPAALAALSPAVGSASTGGYESNAVTGLVIA